MELDLCCSGRLTQQFCFQDVCTHGDARSPFLEDCVVEVYPPPPFFLKPGRHTEEEEEVKEISTAREVSCLPPCSRGSSSVIRRFEGF